MFSGQNSALRRQRIFFFIFGYRMICLCCFISLNDTVSVCFHFIFACFIQNISFRSTHSDLSLLSLFASIYNHHRDEETRMIVIIATTCCR